MHNGNENSRFGITASDHDQHWCATPGRQAPANSTFKITQNKFIDPKIPENVISPLMEYKKRFYGTVKGAVKANKFRIVKAVRSKK